MEQAPANLPDFLTRCRNHNIQVILTFPKANPMNPLAQDGPTYGSAPTPTYIDPETALDQIIPSLHLEQRPEILSYDVAWEPHLGTWSSTWDPNSNTWIPGRSAWDGAWSRFIAREFGSVAAANSKFQEDGHQPPHQIATQRSGSLASGLFSSTMPVRAVAGRPVNCKIVMQNLGDAWSRGTIFLLPLQAPKPDYLVNACRRCLDSETATRFGRITRRIRQLDPNHLISCRQGWDGNGNPNVVTN